MIPVLANPLPVPRYHQIYLVLRERLAAGEFARDVPLPGELQLARSYGVSRVTLRAALELLVREKLIVRQRGRGTYLRPGVELPQPGPPLLGLLENLVAMGLKTSVRVLELSDVPASADVAAALKIAPGDRVQKAVRLRSHKGGPVSLLTTYVPAAVARFGRRQLAAKPMLQLLEETGVKVAGAEQTVGAKLADPASAPPLQVELGAALLAVTRLVHDQAQRPVQLLRGLYRPDRYHYRMRLTRGGDDIPRVWVNNDLIHRAG
ncbi:MAG TPA: GntR family transcriptional regulator [Burkholderiales bacterium]|nr:GntR family transcriptional regulator [Burkholderiales bacterium]